MTYINTPDVLPIAAQIEPHLFERCARLMPGIDMCAICERGYDDPSHHAPVTLTIDTRAKLGELLDLVKAWQANDTRENAKAIDDWIAANESAIEEVRGLVTEARRP